MSDRSKQSRGQRLQPISKRIKIQKSSNGNWVYLILGTVTTGTRGSKDAAIEAANASVRALNLDPGVQDG